MVNRILTLIIVVVVIGGITNLVHYYDKKRFIWEPTPVPKTTTEIVKEKEVVNRDEQVENLAAIIRHSFRSDSLERLLVALAAKNTTILLGKDYKWVFDNAAEMVPPWSKKSSYFRKLLFVRGLASAGEWAAATSLSEQVVSGKYEEPYKSLFEKMPETQKCVTTYFRPEGNKNPQSTEDLELMQRWEPKALITADKAFWLCLPKAKPKT